MTFALEKKKLAPFQRQYFAWTQNLIGPQTFEVIIIIVFYFWLYGGVNLHCAQQCLGNAVKEVNWFSINKRTQKKLIGVEGKSRFTTQSSHSNQQF